jgi:uncharacterized membrane protein
MTCLNISASSQPVSMRCTTHPFFLQRKPAAVRTLPGTWRNRGSFNPAFFIRETIMPNPKSTAQIAGHPIHPMLIPFPIAFFVSAFLSDLAFWRTSNEMWSTASTWLLGAGLVMAALAAVMGLIDVLGDVQIRNLSDAWLHAGGNVLAVVIELYNWYSRYEHGSAAVVPTGLVLSLIVVLVLLFTGWKGWEMVYRHRVGVSD